MDRKGLQLLIVGALVSVVIGCGSGGPKLHSVKGKVTKGGNAVEGVTVTMVATEGGFPPISATAGADGSFTMMTATGRLGAPEGTYKVFITPKSDSAPVTGNPNGGPPSNVEAIMKQYGGGGKGRSSAPPSTGAASGAVIPIELQSADKSPLRLTVPLAEDWVIEIP